MLFKNKTNQKNDENAASNVVNDNFEMGENFEINYMEHDFETSKTILNHFEDEIEEGNLCKKYSFRLTKSKLN